MGLKAPSTLSVGAAVAPTKDTVLAQPPGLTSGRGQSGAASEAAAAAAAAPAQANSDLPVKPVVQKRSLEGLDDTVVKSIKALCQVTA